MSVDHKGNGRIYSETRLRVEKTHKVFENHSRRRGRDGETEGGRRTEDGRNSKLRVHRKTFVDSEEGRL